MKKKWLGIMLAFFVVAAAVVVTSVVMNNTNTDASESLTISVEKTAFAIDEPIKVTITGLTEELRAHDLEIRLEKDLVPAAQGISYRIGYFQYFDIGSSARDENGNLLTSDQLSDTRTVTFQNGGRSHPTSGGTATFHEGYFTLWVLDFTDSVAIGNRINISIGDGVKLSTQGTEFKYGEGIAVTIEGLTEDLRAHDLEFRLEKRIVAADEGHKARTATGGSLQYFDIGLNARDEMANLLTSDQISDTRVMTFKNGGRVHPEKTDYGYVDITPGAYTLWVLDFTKGCVISNKIDILVYDMTISTGGKTEFIQGEEILIDFEGYDNHYGTNKETEIRLEYGWGLDAPTYAKNRTSSWGCIDLNIEDYTGNNVYIGDSGTKSLPNNDARYLGYLAGNTSTGNKYTTGLGYPAGKYTLWALDYSQNLICSNKIEIIIREPEPKLTLAKDSFAYGEPIEVSFEEVTDYLMKSCTAYVEIDIFQEGNIPGTTGFSGSKAGYVMYTKSGTVDMTGGEGNLIHSGTLSYPDDDTDRKGVNFPLAAGNYCIGIRKDNTIIGDLVYFKVTNPVVSVGQSEYEFGEDITVNFSDVYPDIKSALELRLYPENYVVGDTQSYSWASMVKYNAEDGTYVLGQGTNAGTLTFPENDARDPKLYEVYPAGKYNLVMVDDKGVVRSNVATFTIKEPNATVQPVVKDDIAMHQTVNLGSSVTEAPVMKYTVDGVTTEVIGTSGSAEGEWVFAFEGIVPQNMGMTIEAKLYASENVAGTAPIDTYSYSMQSYCQTLLEAYQGDEYKAMRTMILAMLDYGTEAQKYFDNETDETKYVNKDLDAYASDKVSGNDMKAAEGKIDTPVSGDPAEGYVWKSASLSLWNKVKIRLKFKVPDITKVTIDIGGQTYTYANGDFIQSGDYWFVYSEGFNANQFANSVTAKFLDENGQQIGEIVTYSVNTYVAHIGTRPDSTVYNLVQTLHDYAVAASGL